MAQKYHKAVRKRDLPTALRSNKPHIVAGKKLSDNSPIEEIGVS